MAGLDPLEVGAGQLGVPLVERRVAEREERGPVVVVDLPERSGLLAARLLSARTTAQAQVALCLVSGPDRSRGRLTI